MRRGARIGCPRGRVPDTACSKCSVAEEEGRATYLVTGDDKLQKLASYQGVTILSPRDFLDVLAAQDAE